MLLPVMRVKNVLNSSGFQFATYVPRLIALKCPLGVTNEGRASVLQFAALFTEKVVDNVKRHVIVTKRQTFREKDLMLITYLILPSPILEHVRIVTRNAISEFMNFNKNYTGKKRVTAASKSGLVFPPSRFRSSLKEIKQVKRVSDVTSVIGASLIQGVTEFLLMECTRAANVSSVFGEDAHLTCQLVDFAIKTSRPLRVLMSGKPLPELTIEKTGRTSKRDTPH